MKIQIHKNTNTNKWKIQIHTNENTSENTKSDMLQIQTNWIPFARQSQMKKISFEWVICL